MKSYQTIACRLLLLVELFFAGSAAVAANPPTANGVGDHLGPENLAVIVNDADPNSVEVGEYYRVAREIPLANMVHVHVEPDERVLTVAQFTQLKSDIDRQLPEHIEAMVLMWTTPYAVACNSITAALTVGFDPELCQHSCGVAKASRYFDSPSRNPRADFGMRLTMLLPTGNVAEAKALIDRGVASKAQPGTAFFLSTSDPARNVRAKYYPPQGYFPQKRLTIKVVHADALSGANDVMFYFTGLKTVGKLETLHFLPGALADHLTSLGGDLLGQEQMSSLRWLEAGATASYGTVSEPCNYPQKFPQPSILLKQYLFGASAIEAYWKSVAWPAQGLFVGEPLAAPYR